MSPCTFPIYRSILFPMFSEDLFLVLLFCLCAVRFHLNCHFQFQLRRSPYYSVFYEFFVGFHFNLQMWERPRTYYVNSKRNEWTLDNSQFSPNFHPNWDCWEEKQNTHIVPYWYWATFCSVLRRHAEKNSTIMRRISWENRIHVDHFYCFAVVFLLRLNVFVLQMKWNDCTIHTIHKPNYSFIQTRTGVENNRRCAKGLQHAWNWKLKYESNIVFSAPLFFFLLLLVGHTHTHTHSLQRTNDKCCKLRDVLPSEKICVLAVCATVIEMKLNAKSEGKKSGKLNTGAGRVHYCLTRRETWMPCQMFHFLRLLTCHHTRTKKL